MLYCVCAGELFTYRKVDREESALFHVPVTATDGGGRSAYCVIRVNVADQGDNAPQFSVNDYKANVYSSAPVGTAVLQVCTDESSARFNASRLNGSLVSSSLAGLPCDTPNYATPPESYWTSPFLA